MLLTQCDFFLYLESKFDNSFDAVVCLTTALPHLHTDEDLVLAITYMKKRLNRGSLLIFTLSTTHMNLSLLPIEFGVNREYFSKVFVKELG